MTVLLRVSRSSCARKHLTSQKCGLCLGTCLMLWLFVCFVVVALRSQSKLGKHQAREPSLAWPHMPVGTYPTYCVDLNRTLRVEKRIVGYPQKPECHELCAKEPGCYFSVEAFGTGKVGYGQATWELKSHARNSTPANCTLYPKAALCFDERPKRQPNTVGTFVIGHAFGGRAQGFLSSLRGVGYKGKVELFVSREDTENVNIMNMLECYRVRPVVPVEGSMRKLGLGLRRHQHLAARLTELLEQGTNPDTWVAYLDTRDTFFQANTIFDGLEQFGAQLLFMAESAQMSNYHNFIWANVCWPKDRFYKNRTWWARYPVVCSGAMVGRMSAVLRMCQLVVAEVERTVLAGKCPNYRDVNGDHGLDQGFVNRLYYRTNLLTNWTRLLLHGQGPVVHMSGRAAGQLIPRDREGYLISFERPSRRVPVVHQYDRLPPLNDFFLNLPPSSCVTW